MRYSLRDAVTIDGHHNGRIVGVSSRDFNVEMEDGRIRANVEAERIAPRAAVRAVRSKANA